MKERVLVIAAHPDDEVLGMGGTIAKLAESGNDIALLIVTDGSSTQYKDKENIEKIIDAKKEETKNSCAILGINRIYYAALPDMKLDTVPHTDINAAIERIILEFEPSAVYTHFWGDVNKDHRLVYESTLVACRPTQSQCVKKIFAYSVPSSTEWNIQKADTAFMPNCIVDISGNYAEKKYRAIECYHTELREYPHPRSVEYLKIADVAEGNHYGLMAAESFVLLRSIE